ncbi:MAG TPA: UDP-galactopyranose mutase [Bdellovibrionales bacterium]|nr:UDP-galactopyranose mutase [Bdellovibrionales bacterium]
MKKQIAIVGAGFAGAVLARELAETGDYTIDVIESRDHVAGNCHTYRDSETGVMIHQYGPHIFQTSRDDVWNYVNRFGKFGPYTNRVKAHTKRGVYSLPINLLTINQFFGKSFNPRQAREFVEGLGDQSITEPKSFEDQALKFLGHDLYQNFFYGYTKKQWGVEPSELPASILKRLPVRFNYDDNYYVCKFQGIPLEGYTSIVEKILDHASIRVTLNTKFEASQGRDYAHVFFSGPIDSYFGYELGRLQYRSLMFERHVAEGDYQGNPVINYCEQEVPYTRITEHKHFTPWEEHEKTVVFKEYSKLAEGDDPLYYPLRLEGDKTLLQRYVELARSTPKVTFIGRMGTYRYLDMHVVIGESLDLAKRLLECNPETDRWPTFSADPL